jgi:hypothetical protein
MIPLGILAGQISGSPELVINGDFASSAGWTLGGGWSISGGVASTSSGGDLSRTPSVPITSGTYRTKYTVVSRASGTTTIKVSGVPGATRSTTGTFTEDIVIGADTSNQTIVIAGGAGGGAFSGAIDNVSVTKIA